MDQQQKKNGEESVQDVTSVAPPEEEESLTLKLGGRSYATEEPAVRPNKRVRSGSPGNVGNYPTCQVDDCKTDLSNAKDYHRRHKVCEVHSKTTKAMVGNQMQRFCQQCSRSCRRRLAGHNRRRRKTQAEDASSRLLLPPNRSNTGGGNLDIVNLLAILARLQGEMGSFFLPIRLCVWEFFDRWLFIGWVCCHRALRRTEQQLFFA
ncbi:unnamed protein product [Spirodela intermedia]|uniref:SBP-type domain-containing protein n=1 Tax=Spirodela intermedia TaxID=51605 RepID=A0A7I8JM98_SPIIN|nr:unnamed protein product [Spirodela intermedia]CAA6670935.1 unnamed protein product [Spirodela intermedia]